MKYLLTALLALPLACRADDVQTIRALYQKWHQAVEAADIKFYVSVLAPDVRLLPPGAEPIDSAASYAAFLAPVFESANYRIDVLQPQVDVVDDIAVAEYEYIIHLEMKETAGAITQPGALTAAVTQSRYFDVLKKNESGQWQVWRHTWQVVNSE